MHHPSFQILLDIAKWSTKSLPELQIAKEKLKTVRFLKGKTPHTNAWMISNKYNCILEKNKYNC
jgi:hypothetical protein